MIGQSMVLSYDKQTINAPNPIARFAHRRRVRLALQLINRIVPPSGTIADFGPGDGYLLHCLRALRPDLRLHGIEDTMNSSYPEISFVRDFSTIPDQSLDAVTAFEVMEHMLDTEIDRFIRDVQRVLRREAVLIVSVPIMYGASLPLKELNRKLLHRQKSEYTAGEFVRATLGYPVERPPDPRPTHKGFDFRVLRRLLDRSFNEEKLVRSPFALLPWWLNSQIFFCLRFCNVPDVAP
jgi:hypothetical protein